MVSDRAEPQATYPGCITSLLIEQCEVGEAKKLKHWSNLRGQNEKIGITETGNMGLFEEGGHMSPASVLEFRQFRSSESEGASTERFRQLMLHVDNLMILLLLPPTPIGIAVLVGNES